MFESYVPALACEQGMSDDQTNGWVLIDTTSDKH